MNERLAPTQVSDDPADAKDLSGFLSLEPRLAGRRLARRLDGSGATKLEVGGKAAWLDRLVGYGFPVPQAFALTADAYRAFVASGDLDGFIGELRATPPPPADAIQAETIRVDTAFLDRRLPSEIEETVRAIARRLLAASSVAVRSSATAEDLAAASFAGQYRTFLGVGTEDEVIDAVRRCWASLWGPAVRAYRRREGTSEEDLAMGVIIQAMAAAQWAGVLFTRDPQGDPGSARIEAVRGLGESLVSGRVTPHDYTIDRASFTVRAGHTHWPPTFLEDLLRLGLRVERAMGAPQDIEWAHADGRLYLLQTRPITVRGPRGGEDDGFDTTPVGGATYTPAGVQEMLPGVIPPLLWTINAPLLENAFRSLFADLGVPIPPAEDPYLALGRFRGRAALNLSLLREAAVAMPGSSPAEVERQYLGRVLSKDDPRPSSAGRLGRAIAGIRSLQVRRRVEDEVEVFTEAVHGVVALGVSPAELPIRHLLAYRTRVRDLAFRGYAAEVAAAAGAAAAYRALESTLGRWVGQDRSSLWAQRVTATSARASGLESAFAIWDLYAECLCGSPALAAVRAAPEKALEERLPTMGEDGQRVLAFVGRIGRHVGSMSIYGGPTWDEHRAQLWDHVRGTVRCCDDDGCELSPSPDVRLQSAEEARRLALAELQAELRRSWKWQATRVLTGQIVDVRGRLLRKLVADASRFLQLREQAKAALLVLGGEERRLILEATRRLEASGSLSGLDDSLLLSDRELEELLVGGEPVSAEELTRRRNALARAQAAEPLPETFEGTPGAVELPALGGDVIQGWAASPGRAQGSARILRRLTDGRDLLPGEILVARSTDASWTPLFLIAGGIVLEEGGPLSHAAIVAREFGVPAVLNVKGALRALATGERLDVDGSTGMVVRVRTEVAA